MTRQRITEAERLIARLKAEGWREQRSGTVYINGTIATNLLKDGNVLSLRQELYPDEEFVEQEWGGDEA